MTRRGKDGSGGVDRPPSARDSRDGEPGFSVREPVGRALKAMFDEVIDQPIPEKLRKLLQELELKKSTDS